MFLITVLEDPKTIPRLDSRDSTYIVVLTAKIYDKGRRQREKAHRMKSGGNQASFQESYPSGITQDTHSSSTKWDMGEVLSVREAHYRLSAQGFYWGLVT